VCLGLKGWPKAFPDGDSSLSSNTPRHPWRQAEFLITMVNVN
jgi:hypothetical protein